MEPEELREFCEKSLSDKHSYNQLFKELCPRSVSNKLSFEEMYSELTSVLLINIRDGLHISFLNDVETKLLQKQLGDDWVTQLGFDEGDLDKVVNAIPKQHSIVYKLNL